MCATENAKMPESDCKDKDITARLNTTANISKQHMEDMEANLHETNTGNAPKGGIKLGEANLWPFVDTSCNECTQCHSVFYPSRGIQLWMVSNRLQRFVNTPL